MQKIFVLVRHDTDDGSINFPIWGAHKTLAGAQAAAAENYEMLFESRGNFEWEENGAGCWLAEFDTCEYYISEQEVQP